MTHSKRDDPPTKALQHSALHRDPGASARDQRFDNIVSHYLTKYFTKQIIRTTVFQQRLRPRGLHDFGRCYLLLELYPISLRNNIAFYW